MIRSRFTDPIEPMTLGNVRANGARLCHHQAILSAEQWPDSTPVPTFGPRMVRTRCGIIGADARPWVTHPEDGIQ